MSAVSPVSRLTVTGHYAGPLTRGVAAVLDVGVILVVYTLTLSGLQFLSKTFFGDRFNAHNAGILGAVALALWAFAYTYTSLAVAGRTLGMGLVGLRVVTRQGATIGGRAAFVRTLVLPVSILCLGLGLVGIVFGRENRAWHDQAAHTCVVYDWGARTAQLPGPLTEFLARHQAESDSAPPPSP
jgi:uncharacterized RDD family membrane protein YckC